MKPWPEVRLGEVLRRSAETILPSPGTDYREITVRLWGKGAVLRGVASRATLAGGRRFVARPGQLILSRIDARNGAIALVPDDLNGSLVTNDFPLFDLDRSKLEPAFFGWFSKTAAFVDLCRQASEGTTNRVRLQEDRFLGLEIPLPPLAEQRRIMARIEELAAKIEEARVLRQRTCVETEAVVKSAMLCVFKPGPAYREVSLQSVCSEIIDNLRSNPVYADQGVPCVRSPDVGCGRLRLAAALKTSEEEYNRRTVRGEPRADDIVLVREGGGAGKVAIVEGGERFSLGQRVMLLRPDTSRVLPKFFLHQLLSPAIYEEQILTLLKGSASPHLNIAALRKFKFYLPSLSEQQRVVIYLDNLLAKIDLLTQLQAETAAELDALLPSVLSKAFQGEL